jgi:hypothetical protein
VMDHESPIRRGRFITTVTPPSDSSNTRRRSGRPARG